MIKSKLIDSFKNNISYQKITNVNDEICEITSNLQNANASSLVFYKFNKFNQTEKDAFQSRLKKRPCLLIVNKNIEDFYEGDFFVVETERYLDFQVQLASEFYPFRNQTFYGVTGTNGKTSVAYLSMQVANKLGFDSLYMGTLGLWRNGKCLIEEINNTTPSIIEFHKMINDYAGENDRVFVEVSSHALDQKRLHGIQFENVAWTNLTQDHLDYHKTMDEYFRAKLKIINCLKNKESQVVIPLEQNNLYEKIKETIRDISIIRPINLETMDNSYNNVFSKGFNKSNLEVALALNLGNCKLDKKVDLLKIEPPPGRFMKFEYESNVVVVDYAHTPDALENILFEVKSVYSDKKLVTIFGCGGDRDRVKRPIMGKVALKYSDKVVVTSDNPRTEDPMLIIQDIIGENSDFNVTENRKEAILNELKDAQNIVLVVAGKGHEPYQEINGIKHPYSDIETVKSFINEI